MRTLSLILRRTNKGGEEKRSNEKEGRGKGGKGEEKGKGEIVEMRDISLEKRNKKRE